MPALNKYLAKKPTKIVGLEGIWCPEQDYINYSWTLWISFLCQ